MSQATVTVTGYVGTTPPLHLSANQVPWTSFRVASTRRVRDGVTGEWQDGRTTWFTVKAFGRAARTVTASLVQGQPVVVTGRLSSEEWVDKEGRERYALIVEADAVGPDATRGLTSYTKVVLDELPGPPGPGGGQGQRPDPWQTGLATQSSGAAGEVPPGAVPSASDDGSADEDDVEESLTGAARPADVEPVGA